MDELDRKLIAELKINGRASIPQLAQLLGVARATAQKRLDRLIDNGDIKGFTIKLKDDVDEKRIRAFMVIEINSPSTKHIIARIKRTPGLLDVYNTNGKWDIIAIVEVSNIVELNDVISTIRSSDGVAKSETFIILGPA
ncbi:MULTISPECIES: Lrp/AsnC family transcriptional regulator [unclassified Bartonella]|uniref:Lrp/AsnC family transcriptional regulator n=1 Tax=unclassified Bartonella TaxID=2645622 RepID=UPI0021C63ECB|nr:MULTISPECIES: Lrp/AsnC family transcriptional regulator [unclassified Bartonella]UXN02511.1 Lrp/AsnC family transcriptional regulator [Bartonella sp. HY406]UXN05482.1 Lrp/AsnC family transcriptional regulator [Bartonella sp. HY761]